MSWPSTHLEELKMEGIQLASSAQNLLAAAQDFENNVTHLDFSFSELQRRAHKVPEYADAVEKILSARATAMSKLKEAQALLREAGVPKDSYWPELCKRLLR